MSDTFLEADLDVAIADTGKTTATIGEVGADDVESDVFFLDVSKKEGMSVPIPTLDFVALISLAEHALFGGFTEDGGEGLGNGGGVVGHRSGEGIAID